MATTNLLSPPNPQDDRARQQRNLVRCASTVFIAIVAFCLGGWFTRHASRPQLVGPLQPAAAVSRREPAPAPESARQHKTTGTGDTASVTADSRSGSRTARGPADDYLAQHPIDLNHASAEQLEQLPGVGPVMAQRIMTYRSDHGGFKSVDELDNVKGIGPSRLERLRHLVTVQ